MAIRGNNKRDYSYRRVAGVLRGIKGRSLRIAIGMTIMALMLAGSASAVIEIDSCTVISKPGEYVFNKSIINSSLPKCIDINSSDVTLDGAGYTIDGTDSSTTYGVYVYKIGATLTNVSIKNLKLTDWYYGIYYQSARNGNIMNNIANSNWYGIYLKSSNEIAVLNNIANSNVYYGIVLTSSSNTNILLDNQANLNIGGSGIEVSYGSNKNTLINNTANSNIDGISLGTSSNYNDLTNNTANFNTNGGFKIIANYNNLSGNTAISNPYGISLAGNANYLVNNSINMSTQNGISLFFNGVNTIKGNRINNSVTNGINFGDVGSYYNKFIDNTVNGDTYYHYFNESDLIIENLDLRASKVSNLGKISLINSRNITLKNSTFSNNVNGNGLFLYNSINLNIFNVTSRSNRNGIQLSSSSNNTITGSTVRSNSNDGIYILSSNKITVLDTIAYANSRTGIRIESSINNTLINNTANSNGNDGIVLTLSSNTNTLLDNQANSNYYNGIAVSLNSNRNTLTNNTVDSNGVAPNGWGISLGSSSNYNNLTKNTANSNIYGFFIGSDYNNLSENTANSNVYGISLGRSRDNNINSNAINNSGTTGIIFTDVDSYYNTVKDNTVNGDTYYHYVNETDLIIENLDLRASKVSNLGKISFINSSNITLKNSTFSNNVNGNGLFLYNSINSTIFNVTSDSNRYGIQLGASSNNTITISTVRSNLQDGISIISSNKIKILDTIANANSRTGIYIESSINNALINNTANSNGNGIVLTLSSNTNTLLGNRANSNYGAGITVSFNSNKNTLTNNTANSNIGGIFLHSSSNYNNLTKNTANSNTNYAFNMFTSNYNNLSGNTAISNQNGITITGSSSNQIFNNFFNNTKNAIETGATYPNIWNIAKTPGTNIVGGLFLGGNYWSDYKGSDTDGDGIGDIDIPYNSSKSILLGGDFLPLVRYAPQNLTIITQSLPVNVLGQFSSYSFFAAGGKPPYSWSLVSGTIPAGMNFSSDGVLNGTPEEAGNFTFTVRVLDSDNSIAEKTFTNHVSVTLPAPNIRVFKSGTAAVPGRVMDYFIFIQNIDRITATDLEGVEYLEPWFTYISAEPTPANITTINLTNNITQHMQLLHWNISALKPGELKIISYKVRLNSSMPAGGIVTGRICLWPGGIDLMKKCDDKYITCMRSSHSWTLCREAQESCIEENGGECGESNIIITIPRDPNEKICTANKFIQPDQLLVYPIHFENIGNTSALDIFVTDTLENSLNLSSINLLSPNGTFVPLRENEIVTLLERNKTKNITVNNITVNITIPEKWTAELENRTISWSLLGIDLEVNATGEVLYSVEPAHDLPSGTQIRNNATIQFEIFETIITNDTLNIIDDVKPACTIDPLPEIITGRNFTISWSGYDAVGEIDSYTVFSSVDGGGFSPAIYGTKKMNSSFSGEVEKNFSFICIASDTAGNIEVQDPVAEATTYVSSFSSLTVIKEVINDDGGSLQVSDFPLFVNGSSVTSGASNILTQGIYEVSEISQAGYAALFSGDCDANGTVTLLPGDNKTCIITNDDIFDLSPPASIRILGFTNGTTWINWTWINPSDSDFNHTIVYLNGTWKANISSSFFNATGLAPDTVYEIEARTVDKAGNINVTWVNATGRTLPSNVENINFTLPLKIGWNMVSLPIIPDDSSVNAIFGSNVTTVYGWTGTSYVLRNELEPKKGYWVLSSSNYEITVTGTPVVDRNITLTGGWNMVGPVTNGIMVSSLPNVTTVYGWTGTSYIIVSGSNPLTLTKGYWFLTNATSIIQI